MGCGDGSLWQTLKAHGDEVLAVAFSLDGQTLASAGKDKTIRLWDVETGTLMHTIISREDEVLRVGSVYNSRIFVNIDVISKGNVVRLWSAEDVPIGTSFGKLAISEILANQVLWFGTF